VLPAPVIKNDEEYIGPTINTKKKRVRANCESENQESKAFHPSVNAAVRLFFYRFIERNSAHKP